MDIFDAIFICLILVVAGIIIVFIKKSIEKQANATRVWRDFAALKNLQEIQAEKYGNQEAVIIVFEGENQGMPFLMECIATEGTPVRVGPLKMSRGEDTRIFTRMRIALPDLPAGLRIYKKTWFGKIEKAVGMQSINTGDPEFDDAFMVKGDDSVEVLNYLTGSRRTALLTQGLQFEGLELGEEALTYFREGQMKSIEELEAAFSMLGNLADSLSRY